MKHLWQEYKRLQRNRLAQIKRKLKQAGLSFEAYSDHLVVEGEAKFYPKTSMWVFRGMQGSGIDNLIRSMTCTNITSN